jgi:hypothetical protein
MVPATTSVTTLSSRVKVAEADGTGLDAKKMGLLVPEGAECRVDGRGRREYLGQWQAQLLCEPGLARSRRLAENPARWSARPMRSTNSTA